MKIYMVSLFHRATIKESESLLVKVTVQSNKHNMVLYNC